MAVDFTGLILTASQVRSEVGDPSLDPSSTSYVADATLTNLIDRYEQLAQNQVDERIDNMTAEELVSLGLQKQAAVVDLVPATGDADYPNFATVAIDSATYIPVPLRVVDQTSGNELSKDDDIVNSRRAASTLFTIRRWSTDGAKIIKLPANTNTLSVLLVTKLVAETLLKGQIIDDINKQIIQQARQMMAARISTAAGFKAENKDEAP